MCWVTMMPSEPLDKRRKSHTVLSVACAHVPRPFRGCSPAKYTK